MKNVRTPRQMERALSEADRQHDQWSFKRDRSVAALSRHQRMAHGLRMRAEDAERETFVTEARASQRLVDVEASVDQRRRRGQDVERALEVRLQEAILQREEAKRECGDRIVEAQSLLATDQEHTARIELLLKQEQAKSKAEWERVAELEAQSKARLDNRNDDLERERAEVRSRVEAARMAANKRIQEVEQRCAEELAIMRKRLEAAEAQCQERMELEESRRQRTGEVCKVQREVAAARAEVDEQRMRHRLAHQETHCKEQLERVEKRADHMKDFAEEWKCGSVAEIFKTAAQQSRKAHRQEILATHSLEHAAYNLGQHHKTQRQYSASIDGKISKVLQGCLHGGDSWADNDRGKPRPRTLTSKGACPSPRSLPPPSELARLACS